MISDQAKFSQKTQLLRAFPADAWSPSDNVEKILKIGNVRSLIIHDFDLKKPKIITQNPLVLERWQTPHIKQKHHYPIVNFKD